MDKRTIAASLRKTAGGGQYITQNGVKTCMGWGFGRTTETLKGLSYLRRKKTKQYDIDEVAEKISEDLERSAAI